MAKAVDTLTERCIKGITANVDICANYALNSIGIVTALNPILGYEVTAGIAKEASMYNKSIHQIVVDEKKLISQEKWDEIYSMDNMIDPEWITGRK